MGNKSQLKRYKKALAVLFYKKKEKKY